MESDFENVVGGRTEGGMQCMPIAAIFAEGSSVESIHLIDENLVLATMATFESRASKE
jgi:hypothetical protein